MEKKKILQILGTTQIETKLHTTSSLYAERYQITLR